MKSINKLIIMFENCYIAGLTDNPKTAKEGWERWYAKNLETVKKLHLHGVSKCIEPVCESPCKHEDAAPMYGSQHDYIGRYCSNCEKWIE